MKQAIRAEIERFVSEYQYERKTRTGWGTPLVGFASATDPRFSELKTAISPTHAMPCDLLGKAASVVAFFLPFEKTLSKSNREGQFASEDWALAYIETNRLIGDLSVRMKSFLEERGFPTRIIPATHNFDEEKLISDWSHRHVAKIAGLGNFGLNHMLITEYGCCGRVGSLITTVPLEPDPPCDEEMCLYRYDKSCGRCAVRCVNGALQLNQFDRHRCYEMCLTNQDRFESLGLADVCGKCVVAVPCSHVNPVIKKGGKPDAGDEANEIVTVHKKD